jgi:hypothetical protein
MVRVLLPSWLRSKESILRCAEAFTTRTSVGAAHARGPASPGHEPAPLSNALTRAVCSEWLHNPSRFIIGVVQALKIWRDLVSRLRYVLGLPAACPST